jgi:anti-sigma factor RsiW
MIKTFTHNELIQYVYDELPNEVKTQLECTLQTDLELAEECAELLIEKRKLESFKKTPRQQCISNILLYSQTFNLQS